MTKQVTLAVPTYRRYDLLAQMLIKSAEAGTRPPDRYYIVDNGGSLDPVAYGLPTAKVEIYRPGRNLGVSASWNHIHRTVDEYVIMACDDMALYPNTVEALVAAAETHPDVGFFFPSDNAHTMFGVYLQRRSFFEQIGEYDEHFWPAYFEDNDYARRIQLASGKTMSVPDCGMSHFHSGTLKSYSEQEMQQHHSNFERLRAYYCQKWGGPPGHEQFKTPFNR